MLFSLSKLRDAVPSVYQNGSAGSPSRHKRVSRASVLQRILPAVLATSIASANILDSVDVFYGQAGVDLPPPQGIAAAWNWEKAQTGNTHPGPQLPFGMVSVVPYTKAYPTGAGYNKKTTAGPAKYQEKLRDAAFGFTHFQQSGTGAILSYYNFLRVMPLSGYSKDNREKLHKLSGIKASPGYYAATFSDSGVSAEITTSNKVAYHRYTLPAGFADPKLLIELTSGGIGNEREKVHYLSSKEMGPGRIGGMFQDEGFPYYYVLEVSGGGEGAYYGDGDPKIKVSDSQGEMLANKIRRKPKPFYVDYVMDLNAETVNVKVAFSFRSLEQAEKNLAEAPANFDAALAAAQTEWTEALERIPYEAKDAREEELFYSNLYHSLTKPSICMDESPWWQESPFVTDFSTLWDLYKTQLPLVFRYYPERATPIVETMMLAMETHGQFPCGYMKTTEKGFNRFRDQATGIEWVVLADAYRTGVPGIDWPRILKQADAFAAQERVQEVINTGRIAGLPYSHTLDVTSAFAGICFIAKGIGDSATFEKYAPMRELWKKAYDPSTGLLKDEKYYEGTKWNYSFRPHYGMAERVELAGGKAAFTKLLETFMGFEDVAAGIVNTNPGSEFKRLKREERFEGLNNECDMEAPYAYRWTNKPEREQEVIEGVLRYQFGTGPHGLPGNNDSGGTSSWYVLSALGEYPLVEFFE
ncbi:MAG: glycoside hydrolase domain-containing protein [Opitutales bacterium]